MSIALYLAMGQPEMLRKLVAEKAAQLERQANHDHLTCLPNRRLLRELIAQVVSEARRSGRRSALLFLDLDGFKSINDLIGHKAGDDVLRVIAARLRLAVRESDVVGRLGGDEFAVLLLETGSTEAINQVAGKLIDAVEQPIDLGAQPAHLSVSIGITLIPDDGDQVEELLRNADMAMSAAKRGGKGRYEYYDSTTQAEVRERIAIENDLVGVCERDELELHLQPIVMLNTRWVTHYEALLRWHHPTRGMLSPDRFIGIAEHSGAIVDIGYWVIRRALQILAADSGGGQSIPAISINLSPRQLKDAAFFATTRSIIEASGVDRRRLSLEVTENMLNREPGAFDRCAAGVPRHGNGGVAG